MTNAEPAVAIASTVYIATQAPPLSEAATGESLGNRGGLADAKHTKPRRSNSCQGQGFRGSKAVLLQVLQPRQQDTEAVVSPWRQNVNARRYW